MKSPTDQVSRFVFLLGWDAHELLREREREEGERERERERLLFCKYLEDARVSNYLECGREGSVITKKLIKRVRIQMAQPEDKTDGG